MIKADLKEAKRLERDLKLFNRRAFPYASRQALTAGAFEGRRLWQQEINNRLTTRNKWTERSVRVERARTLDVPRQQAVLGSVADYMDTTEEGGTVSGDSGAHNIPTSYSAGQQGQRPRTRMPRRPNRMQNIKLKTGRIRAANQRQRNLIAVRQAVESGNKFVYLKTNRSEGIYRVTGSKRNPRVRMVQDLSRPSVSVPATPTLQPALKLLRLQMPRIYIRALQQQLKRHGILGYGR